MNALKSEQAGEFQDTVIDVLISAVYTVATGARSWENWLDLLLENIGPGVLRIERERAGNRSLVANRQLRKPGSKGLVFTASQFSGEQGDTAFLIYRGKRSANVSFLLNQLLPHVTRVLQLQDDLNETNHRVVQIAAAITDGLGVGVIVLHGREHNVCHHNARASVLAESTGMFRIEHHGLIIDDPGAHRLLRDALVQVESQAARFGRHVILGSEEKQVSLLCYRLDRCTGSYIDGDASKFIVVFVSAIHEVPALRMEYLQKIFSLTPKESRLALGLALGSSMEDLATRYHVSRHTLRAQLKSILKKTSTRSQPALITRMLADPRLLFAPTHDEELAS